MRYTVQIEVTIEVDADDGREALPAAVGYFAEALDWATERYEGDAIKAVSWKPHILSTVGE